MNISEELAIINNDGLIECVFCSSTFNNEKEAINHLKENGFILEDI